ncbi:hypothetical protein Tco_0283449, partial [Tanacetum coccineum]
YVSASDTKTEPFEVPTSSNYAPGLNIETKPFKEDPQEAEPLEEDLSKEHLAEEDESLSTQDPPTPPTQTSPTIPTSIIQPALIPSFPPYRLHPSRSCFMFTQRKTVWAPYTLTPAIEAAIFEEISAPPFKRTRSPSPPPPPP